MLFRILGPLDVLDDAENSLGLGRPKHRQLLAALILDANRPVPVERLVCRLWSATPPASAPKNVHTYVNGLRQVLQRASPAVRLTTGAGGYQLTVSDGELDAHEFERLVAAGERELRGGNPEQAYRTLSRALQLWRSDRVFDGIELSGDHSDSFGLLERRAAAEESCYAAALASGRHEELVPSLAEATVRNPLRERLWAFLMTALYRCGRQADALAAYDRVRVTLAAELGIKPGDELNRLQNRVLNADPTLAHPDRSAVTAGAATGHPVPAELPADLVTYVGRATELAQLTVPPAADVSRPTVFAIVGAGGVGKTSLAVRAAHRLAPHFPDGQIFLDLHGFSVGTRPVDPGEALDHALRSLGFTGERSSRSPDVLSARWRSLLADRRLLLVLDNVSSAAQVRPLLPATPHCRTLVTSRQRLADLDDACFLDLDLLPTDEARELFLISAGLPESDLLSAEERSVIDEIIGQCAGLPLAVRLAAAKLRRRRAWTVTELLDRLRDHRTLVAELDNGERSVLGTVLASDQHLDADQRRLLRLVSVHPGPDIDATAAAALTGYDTAHTGRLLDDLLDVHLLEQAHADRYHLHDLVRACARTFVDKNDATEGVVRLYHHYLTAAATALDLMYPHTKDRRRFARSDGDTVTFADHRAAAGWLDRECHNLLACAWSLAAAGLPGYVEGVSTVVAPYLRSRGRYRDAQALHELAAASAGRSGDDAARTRALINLGGIHRLHRDWDSALDALGTALSLAERIGDRHGELDAIWEIGYVRYLRCEFDTAHQLFDRQLTLSRGVADRNAERAAMWGLGMIMARRGDLVTAAACHERAYQLATGTGDRLGEISALVSLGRIAALRGDQAGAVESHSRALALARDQSYVEGELVALCNLGVAHLQLRDWDRAQWCFSTSLRLATAERNRNIEFESFSGLGEIHLAAGRTSEAIRCLQRAVRLAQDIDQPDDQARAHTALGRAYEEAGDPTTAAHHHRLGDRLVARIGLDTATT